jgi:peptidoglycan/LPS O-acetylase OafA/YrhL
MAAKRFEALDALRGVAALAVVIFHLHVFKLSGDLAPHAYLAVDFFFVLSGFVVAHAYEAALRERLSWLGFARRRLARLLPLAVLGAAAGLVVLIVKQRLFPDREDPLTSILLSGLLNLFMLPTVFSGPAYDHEIFPGDSPLWSLFFELAINFAWAAVAPRLGTRSLLGAVAVGAAMLVAMAARDHTANMGFDIPTFWGGGARVLFGFSLGVLLHRLRDSLRLPGGPATPPLLALCLVVIFAFPLSILHGRAEFLAFDLTAILLILPAIVVVAINQGSAAPIDRLLGALSYPIYVIHWPILAVASGLHQKLGARLNPHLLAGASVGVILIAGWLALKVYDAPFRALLARRVRA